MLESKDYLNVILDMTQLIAKLDKALTDEQRARRQDVEQLHAQYGMKLQNMKDTLGDREGTGNVPASTE